MRVTVLGAAGEVTGSSYLVDTGRASVLVDFGLFQGSPLAERKNRRPPAFAASKLDAVVATHAHIDHTGRLPLLERLGFARSIFATPATVSLSGILLRDSAKLQEQDFRWLSRRRERAGQPVPRPLYSIDDVERCLERFESVPYQQAREVAPGVSIRLLDAGHILGSASVEMAIDEGGRRRTIAFSGDVGPHGAPLLRDPSPVRGAELVFLESTYGDRNHRSLAATVEEFRSIVGGAAWAKEKVLVPAFAVGRTQQLIYCLGELLRDGLVPRIPTYVDSPMAIEATELYRRHRDLFDADAWRIIESGGSPLSIPELRYLRTSEESRAINDQWGAGIVIAGSGMCTGGRIVHHLIHNLWRRNVHVVFAGFQAEGTLGRRLVSGQTPVRIRGKTIAVRAQIHTLGGFSAHAGQAGLVEWARAASENKPRFLLTHGEEAPRRALGARLEGELGATVGYPTLGQVIDV